MKYVHCGGNGESMYQVATPAPGNFFQGTTWATCRQFQACLEKERPKIMCANTIVSPESAHMPTDQVAMECNTNDVAQCLWHNLQPDATIIIGKQFLQKQYPVLIINDTIPDIMPVDIVDIENGLGGD